jgi:hypothetical protein
VLQYTLLPAYNASQGLAPEEFKVLDPDVYSAQKSAHFAFLVCAQKKLRCVSAQQGASSLARFKQQQQQQQKLQEL